MSDAPKALAEAKPSDIDFHLRIWCTNRRGGGKVPADLEWTANPKQWQEENGANLPQGAVAQALRAKR